MPPSKRKITATFKQEEPDSDYFHLQGPSCRVAEREQKQNGYVSKPRRKRQRRMGDGSSDGEASPVNFPKPPQHLKERDRAKAFNQAFDQLRHSIPSLPKNKKLSKIEILRLAICYMAYLDFLLTSD